MPDDRTPPETGAEHPTEPNRRDDAAPDDREDGGDAGNEPEGLKRALDAERKRARELDREVKRLTRIQGEAGDKEKSEIAKAVERAERAERAAGEQAEKYRRVRAEQQVRDAAAAAGARNATTVYRLVKDDLEIDEADGTVGNLDAVLKAVRKESPELFGAAGKADAGAGNGQSGVPAKSDMEGQIRRVLGRTHAG